MKKVFAILITLIMLTSLLEISIDRHYCGGELAGLKLSVTGKLASCGMEKSIPSCTHQNSISEKCCQDQLTLYSLTSKYIPEYFKLSYPITGKDNPAFSQFSVLFRSSDLTNTALWVLPPGEKLNSEPSQSMICVFRI